VQLDFLWDFASVGETFFSLLDGTNVSNIEQRSFKNSINSAIVGNVVNSRLNSHSRFVFVSSLGVIKWINNVSQVCTGCSNFVNAHKCCCMSSINFLRPTYDFFKSTGRSSNA